MTYWISDNLLEFQFIHLAVHMSYQPLNNTCSLLLYNTYSQLYLEWSQQLILKINDIFICLNSILWILPPFCRKELYDSLHTCTTVTRDAGVMPDMSFWAFCQWLIGRCPDLVGFKSWLKFWWLSHFPHLPGFLRNNDSTSRESSAQTPFVMTDWLDLETLHKCAQILHTCSHCFTYVVAGTLVHLSILNTLNTPWCQCKCCLWPW
jgi:hypothetical protein